MALKHSESRVFAVELGKIEEEIKSQRFHTMVDITPTKSNDVVHIYWYEHDVSLSSFGEKIMIQLQEINADSTRVDITSESLQASKMIDVGSRFSFFNINKLIPILFGFVFFFCANGNIKSCIEEDIISKTIYSTT